MTHILYSFYLNCVKTADLLFDMVFYLMCFVRVSGQFAFFSKQDKLYRPNKTANKDILERLEKETEFLFSRPLGTNQLEETHVLFDTTIVCYNNSTTVSSI